MFTTRPDTIYGVTFLVLAPEHELVQSITTEAQKAEVESYVQQVSLKSERDRQSDVKKILAEFLQGLMLSILLQERKWRFGLAIMYWLLMVQAL